MSKMIQDAIDSFGREVDRIRKFQTKSYEDVRAIQLLARPLLQNELRRIEKKLGSHHPRTVRLKAKYESQLNFITAATQKWEVSRVVVAKVSKNDAGVHGRVIDSNGLGIRGLGVYATDVHGDPITSVEESVTDRFGYYALKIPSTLVQGIAKSSGRSISISVNSPTGHLLQTSSELVMLKAGNYSTKLFTLQRSNLRTTASTVAQTRQRRAKSRRPRSSSTTTASAGETAPTRDNATGSDANSAVFHGHVVNKSGVGLPDLLVAAVDEHGESLVEQRTDDTGYFRLIFRELYEASEMGVDGRRGRSRGRLSRRRRSRSAEEMGRNRNVQIRVSGTERDVIYRESHVMRPGGEVYQKIVIEERGISK